MSDSMEHRKTFRAPKTTQNKDDFRVLLAGSVITIMLMLMVPLIHRAYDTALADRPFVVATVEIIETDDYIRPMLLYDADAKIPADATWIATIRDERGRRISTRRGTGSYSTQEDNPRLWTWAAFFETDESAILPDVPEQPFQVCVRYISVARGSGAQDETPEKCSKVFYPHVDNNSPITNEGDSQ